MRRPVVVAPMAGGPSTPELVIESIAGYVSALAAHAEAVGAPIGDAVWDDDRLEETIEVPLAAPPALVSLTFGCPSAGETLP